MRIFVNGEAHSIANATVSYEDIVKMDGYDQRRVLSVTYRSLRKGDSERSGIMRPGKSIQAEDGMRFNVADTSGA